MYGALPQESSARPELTATGAASSGGGGGGGAADICSAVGREPRSDTARRVVGAKPVATASTAHSDSVLIFAPLAPWRGPLQMYVDAFALIDLQLCP